MEKAFFQRMRYIIGLKRKYKYKKKCSRISKTPYIFQNIALCV
nr:MAG TPA: hypothetical protein [Caudoviricetes sp.]